MEGHEGVQVERMGAEEKVEEREYMYVRPLHSRPAGAERDPHFNRYAYLHLGYGAWSNTLGVGMELSHST